MITFTKEQLIASALARIDFAEMMLSGELEPLKERTWSIELELARIAMASLEADSNINNHPAHAPLTTRRLHQMRDILSKAAAQRDGGDIGYAMSDAVKLIDGVISAFGAEPVAYADPQAFINFQAGGARREWMWRNPGEDLIPLYAAPQPAPVVPDVAVVGEMPFLGSREAPYISGWNACRTAMLQGGTLTNEDTIPSEPVSEPYTLPPLEYLDTVKFNADCAIQDPESIYANEFFLTLDEVFGERGNYSEPVQAKAVSVLIAEVFRLRGYSPAAPKQEVNRG